MSASAIDYEQLFQHAPNACLVLTAELVIVGANARYLDMAGLQLEDLIGQPVLDAFPARHVDALRQLRSSFDAVVRTGQAHTLDLLHFPLLRRTAQGEIWQDRYWNVTNTPVPGPDGGVAFIINSVEEMTELLEDPSPARPGHGDPQRRDIQTLHARRINRALESERSRLRQMVQQAPGFVAVGRGPQHVFELANTAYYALVGHREILGKPVREALPELEGQGFYELLDRVYQSGEPFIGRAMPVRLQPEPGAPPVELHVDFIYQPIFDQDNQVSGIFVQGHDVTEAHELSLEVTHQAAHDALTGLANRREFERRLRTAMETLNGDAVHSVLYMDLDQFKIVNDTCGHSAGDELLRHISRMLGARLQAQDTLARLGGDEFGVLLEHCPERTAERIAHEIRGQVAALEFAWSGRVFACSLSIGVRSFGADINDLEEVLSTADSACFLAKEKGRNRVQVYRIADEEFTTRRREMDWAGRLRDALREERFVLYAQRIVPLHDRDDTRDRREVLLRLRDTDGSLVLPMAFIPAAERYNIMPAIDRWVVTRSLAYLADSNRQAAGRCELSINLSGATLNDDGFPAFLEETLTRSGVDPRQICFEVTETSALVNLTATSALMRRLKELGLRFALDDFGSGMSSLGYLKHLPVNSLKIDGVFIRNIATDPVDRAMVEAIASVARVMRIKTVAEFVDSAEVADLLAEIGIDFAQGYGMHMPEPLTGPDP